MYFTDGNPGTTAEDRQAIRDAAATVIFEEEQQARDRANNK